MEESPPPENEFEKELKDKIANWVGAVAGPLLVLILAVFHLTGKIKRDQDGVMTPGRALAQGLVLLGVAIGFHGAYFHAYQRFPFVKWILIILGVVSVILGLVVSYQL